MAKAACAACSAIRARLGQAGSKYQQHTNQGLPAMGMQPGSEPCPWCHGSLQLLVRDLNTAERAMHLREDRGTWQSGHQTW